jgi:hypothetical protein
LFFSDGARKKYSSPRPRFPWGSRPVGPAAGLPGLSAKTGCLDVLEKAFTALRRNTVQFDVTLGDEQGVP